jgi:hypothetical protein
MVVISVLLAPATEARDMTNSLTTYSSGALGARGFSEILTHLGWQVSRLEDPISDTSSADAVYAELVPAALLSVAETHILLNRVRAGAGAIVLLGDGAVNDSLHLNAQAGRRGVIIRQSGDTTSCPPTSTSLVEIAARVPLTLAEVLPSGPLHADTVHIVTIRRGFSADSAGARGARAPGIIGIPLGRGRIVALADGELFANDFIRVCRWGAPVAAVRAVEWASARDSGRARESIVFDEYHHGYGHHASISRAVWAWLQSTTAGRTTAQLIIAALLILAAVAARPITPLAHTTIARRSPLEHVAALAQAYEQVKATRSTAVLLVKGVRRRAAHALGLRHATDDQFLAAVAARHPALQADTARARNAMTDPVPVSGLIELAATIDRIDRSVRP